MSGSAGVRAGVVDTGTVVTGAGATVVSTGAVVVGSAGCWTTSRAELTVTLNVAAKDDRSVSLPGLTSWNSESRASTSARRSSTSEPWTG